MGDRLCSPSDEWMPPPPPPPPPLPIQLKSSMRLVQADDISFTPSDTCPVHSPHRLRVTNGTAFRCYNTTPRALICHHHCHHHHLHQPTKLCSASSQVVISVDDIKCPKVSLIVAWK